MREPIIPCKGGNHYWIVTDRTKTGEVIVVTYECVRCGAKKTEQEYT